MNSRKQKNLEEKKISHFRMWKKGKTWCFGAAVLSVLTLGMMLPNVYGSLNTTLVAHADTTTNMTSTNLTIWTGGTNYDNVRLYAYVFNTGNSSLDNTFIPLTNMTGTGGDYASTTITGLNTASLGLIITTQNNFDSNDKLYQGTQAVDANGNINIAAQALSQTEYAVNQKGDWSKTVAVPTITAPQIPNATTGSSVTIPEATITDPNALGKGVVTQETVTGPTGSNFQNTVVTTDSFTPDVAGNYTITYNYQYTNLDTTLSTISATAVLSAKNDLILPTAPTSFEAGSTVNVSASALGVLDTQTKLTPLVSSVSFSDGETTTTAEVDSSGNVMVPASATSYSIVYADPNDNTITKTLTGVVSADKFNLPENESFEAGKSYTPKDLLANVSSTSAQALSVVSVTSATTTVTADASSNYTFKTPGTYKITVTDGIATATYTVNVTSNTISVPTPAPTYTAGNTVKTSDLLSGVTDSDSTVTLVVDSVNFSDSKTGTTSEVKADNQGNYTFSQAGAYTVNYSDNSGATASLTGVVDTQLAQNSVSYLDGSTILDPGTPVDLSKYNVGDAVSVPIAPQITNERNTSITYNGSTVSAGDTITLTLNGQLIYNYAPQQNLTITFWANNSTAKSYDAWVWDSGNTGSWVVLNQVGSTNGYTGTYQGDNATSISMNINSDKNYSNQVGNIVVSVPATGNSEVAINASANATVSGQWSQTVGKGTASVLPTIVAPTDVPTSGSTHHLITIPLDALITDTDGMGNGKLTSITVTGPTGSQWNGTDISSVHSFSPDLAGNYTISYNYTYLNLDQTSSTISATAALNVLESTSENTISSVSGPDIVQKTSTDLSAQSMNVTDSDPTETVSIASVVFTATGGNATVISPDSANATTYTFDESGTYTVTYTDGTGVTQTMSGTVVTAPASFTPTQVTTIGQVGTQVDSSSLLTLVDPNNAAITINEARVQVTAPDGSDVPLDTTMVPYVITNSDGSTRIPYNYYEQDPTFTPDQEGTYTLVYNYTDGQGTNYSKTVLYTVVAQATLNPTDQYPADGNLVVNADDSATYQFIPSNQVTYDDALNKIVSGTTYADGNSDPSNDQLARVYVSDENGNPISQNTDGSYTLSANQNYNVAYVYLTAATPELDEGIQVLAKGAVLPTITAPFQENAPVDTLIDLSKDLVITDSTGSTMDLSTLISQKNLTISVSDPDSNAVTLNSDELSFSPAISGDYTVYYSYIDPTTGIEVSASTYILVQPKVTAPADEALQTGQSFTFGTPSVDDPNDPNANTGGVTDNGGNFEQVAPVLTNNADGSQITPDDGTTDTFSNLAAGTYTASYTYDYTDINMNDLDYNQEFQAIGNQKVYVSNLTLSSSSESAQTNQSISIPTVTDATASDLSNQSDNVAISVISAPAGSTYQLSASGVFSTDTAGDYLLRYSYTDPQSHLLVTADATVSVTKASSITATTLVSYVDGATQLLPESSSVLTGNVGDTVSIPAAPEISNEQLTEITYNGQIVSVGDDVILTANGTLIYSYSYIPKTTTINVTVNQDESGTVLNDTTGYVEITKGSPVESTVTAENGDVTITDTTTNIWHKPVTTTTAVTVNQDDSGTVLNDTTGYVEITKGSPVESTVTAENGDVTITNTTTNIWHKSVTTTTAVTVNQDDSGATLTDTTGYVEITKGSPVESTVTAENGDVTITDTTTNVWHKPVTTTTAVTVNQDDSGTTLTDTTGYVEITKGSPVGTQTTAENGDVTITTTTTNVWHKPVTTTTSVTVNQDESGTVLNDTTGYVEITKGSPVETQTTAENGDVTITNTTTNVWHKPVTTTTAVTVNQDDSGATLTDTTGYVEITKGSPVESTVTAENGDVTITDTTTNIWHKPVTTSTSVTVNQDDSGTDLTETTGYVEITKGSPVETQTTAENGDVTITDTTTNIWHKPVTTSTNVTVNQDDSGTVLTDTTDYVEITKGSPVESTITAENGDVTITDTTTNIWHKPVTTTTTVTVNQDDSGTTLTDTTGYVEITKGSPVETQTTAENGDVTITDTTTNVWHKPVNPVQKKTEPKGMGTSAQQNTQIKATPMVQKNREISKAAHLPKTGDQTQETMELSLIGVTLLSLAALIEKKRKQQ